MTTMLAARALPSHEITLDKIAVPKPSPIDVVVKVASAGLAPGMMHLLRWVRSSTCPPRWDTRLRARRGRRRWSRRHMRRRPGPRASKPQLPQLRLLPERPRHDVPAASDDRPRRLQYCAPCRCTTEYHDGGLAEYVRVPHWLVDPLPESVSFDVAAKVHDLANALRALKCAAVAGRFDVGGHRRDRHHGDRDRQARRSLRGVTNHPGRS